MKSPRVIFDTSSLISQYYNLNKGDIVCGRVRMKRGEEHLLLDLQARGINLIPSAISQMASRSKCFQARIFYPWMLPQTTVIYDTHQLLETINLYQEKDISRVVLKHDRKNAGIGILLYRNIEDIYNQAANKVLDFPFVIQPFIADSVDIRVIIVGDYIEAYTRSNQYNFRNNLHCGGTVTPYQLSRRDLDFCTAVMKRGQFPYGHLDLMATAEGELYLAEMSLRGGIRGARITTPEYKARVVQLDKQLLEDLTNKQ